MKPSKIAIVLSQILLLQVLSPLACRAQYGNSMAFFSYMNSSITNTNTMNFMRKHVFKNGSTSELEDAAKAEPQSKPLASTTFTDTGKPIGISKLVAGVPASSRAESERLFTQILEDYHNKIEAQNGIQKNDIAGAVAVFLVGSYEGYRDVDTEHGHLKALVAQMRVIMGNNPEFASASNTQKQELYEQMAIIGVLMAATREALNSPNVAQKYKPAEIAQARTNLKKAAKAYLEQFLKTDADRVAVTANGLVLK
jgi:hypothetical protein